MADIFFTGFPGFIGKRLAQHILKKRPDSKLTFLVHPKMEQLARKSVQSFPSHSARVVIGDITHPNLGLTPLLAKEIKVATHTIFHLAAIYDLTVDEAIAKRVNVFGTQNILDFFSDAPALRRFNYISTCYVSGDREGTIFATELSMNQKFRNFYESTKYEAEVLVKNRMEELPITVFRPAIVVGDTQTGETDKFDGPYVVMKFLHRLKFLLRLVPNLGYANCEVNTVPVDYVIRVITYLGFEHRARGQTYQICDTKPPEGDTFFSEIVSIIANVRPYNAPFLRFIILKLLKLPFVHLFTGITKQHLDYFSHRGRYRSPNLIRDLNGSHIELKKYSNYYPKLYQFMSKNI